MQNHIVCVGRCVFRACPVEETRVCFTQTIITFMKHSGNLCTTLRGICVQHFGEFVYNTSGNLCTTLRGICVQHFRAFVYSGTSII